ncbi:RNA polymerase sigma-70 factor [Sphingobacterium alkalisoli]|uniref:RNA polymerase sigma-70 factor n=2 Tax=Sphingobacterium alkalisoli TaxID=1874115 RepID=A0A4V5LX85_9SPHI|nr:RNA polymerase sigma-70 factor [Sphingobacterium alkalisoli]
MESFRGGDETTLAFFFDLHYKSLCYFAVPLCQDTQQAEDIVADCFFKLWQNRTEFQTAQNVKAFLYISCRNASLNHLRSLKRRNAAQELYFSQLESGEETILYQIIETEVLHILSREIEELPTKCREVFKMIYIENKKTDEIADLLGISVKTVRGHKARAIELLKSQLLKQGVSAVTLLAFLFLIDRP